MTNRLGTVTQKIATQFGSLYTHVSHDANGRIVEVAFSSPGKFDNSSMGEAMIALGDATTQAIDTINEAAREEKPNGKEQAHSTQG